jgi:hypothetical protein
MPKIIISINRRAAVLCLALAVLNLHVATVIGADAKTELPPAGEITLAGRVMVDDAPAISGQTLFSGSTIVVAPASHSTLSLGNHGRLELSAVTALKLDFSDHQVTVTLKAGRLRLFAPAGVKARLTSADTSVLADSRQPALFNVETGRNGETTVFVEEGQVEMNLRARTQLVTAGYSLSTSGDSPTLVKQRHHASSLKGDGLLAGIGGMLSTLSIMLARSGNQGRPAADLNFGGTVTVLSLTCICDYYPYPEPDPCPPDGCVEWEGK